MSWARGGNTGYALLSLNEHDGLIGQDLTDFISLTDDDKQRETLNVAKRICLQYHTQSDVSEQMQDVANVDKDSDGGGNCCVPKRQKKPPASTQNPAIPAIPKLTFEEWVRWFDATVDLTEAFSLQRANPVIEKSTSSLLKHAGTVLPSKLER